MVFLSPYCFKRHTDFIQTDFFDFQHAGTARSLIVIPLMHIEFGARNTNRETRVARQHEGHAQTSTNSDFRRRKRRRKEREREREREKAFSMARNIIGFGQRRREDEEEEEEGRLGRANKTDEGKRKSAALKL